MTFSKKSWMSFRIDPDGFDGPASVRAYAVAVGLRACAVSMIVTVLPVLALDGLGILPVPSIPAFVIAIVFSCLVCGAIAGLLGAMSGNAILVLLRARDAFEQLSRTDSLSGLLNRRAFSEVLASVRAPASLAILDVDRFKSINDNYGHSAGDAVIRAVSDMMVRAFPAECTVARLGGEEFGVIVPGGTLDERLSLICDACRAIGSETLPIATSTPQPDAIRITVSAGVAEFYNGRPLDRIFAVADKALYLAKAAGRNRIVHESAVPDAWTGRAMVLESEARQAY